MPDIKKIHCNTCNYETNHELRSFCDRKYYEVDKFNGQEVLGWHEDWQYGFWVCRGCDTAILEEKYTDVSMKDNNGDDLYSYEYFPQRSNEPQRKPKRFLHIDENLNSTYKEIIKAYQHGLKIVCAMGVRALLEGICVAEGVDDKKAWGLNEKIKKLQSVSNIPSSIIDGLKSLKFIGDDAAHKLISSNNHTISLSIDLLEALLIHLYEAKFDLKQKAELVKKAHNKSINSD